MKADRTDADMLVADIGGTNARFALACIRDGEMGLESITTYRCADFPSLQAAARAYLETLPRKPLCAALAVAGPVMRGSARMTNLGWGISEDDLVAELGVRRAHLLNDFVALGYAASRLKGEHLARLGPERPGDPNATLAVLGPGTGFGVTALARDGRSQTVVTSEGGHSAFAPQDEVEVSILRFLQTQFGRISIERLLSGPGLTNLHRALCHIEGRAVLVEDPAAITQAADAGDAACTRTLQRFCSILGSVAGDFALSFGAGAGVVIAGGMAPRLRGWLERSDFRARFEDKGRLSAVVKDIPTHLLLHPHAALVGAGWAAV